MSEYLITQLQATPNVMVKLRTRVTDGHGGTRLRALILEDLDTGWPEQVLTPAVFIMIGAQPVPTGSVTLWPSTTMASSSPARTSLRRGGR
jgi:thioredoxin reductase